ncbi:hypothetical protein Tco_0921016 [Tanacetum coccineum]
MEECHKLLTNHVDDAILRYNVSNPLPLGGKPGHVTIQLDFFFNKDLEYLRYGRKVGRPAFLISKMKATYYPNVGLEQLVPDQFWIEAECKYDIAAMYDDYEVPEIHTFSDGTQPQIDKALGLTESQGVQSQQDKSRMTYKILAEETLSKHEFMIDIQKNGYRNDVFFCIWELCCVDGFEKALPCRLLICANLFEYRCTYYRGERYGYMMGYRGNTKDRPCNQLIRSYKEERLGGQGMEELRVHPLVEFNSQHAHTYVLNQSATMKHDKTYNKQLP